MVLAIGVTFQIIEALLKAIDSMKKKKCMIIDQKQITVAENKLLVLKKYVPRNNSPDLPVARNIISQILIVQQYEQETIRRIIVILKKRKSHFSHQTYWTAQRQRQERKKVAKSLLTPDHVYTWSWGQDKFLQRHGKIGKQA